MRKKRYIVRRDEVTITREGDTATIAYKEEGVPNTHFTLGPDIQSMTDEEILECFNDSLRAQAQLAAEYKHVAVEVPLGSPQIRFHPRANLWTPRGGVLRCLLDSDEDGVAVVQIDDQELSMEEFGRMIATYAGWGMRIEFTPEDLGRRSFHFLDDRSWGRWDRSHIVQFRLAPFFV